MHRATGVALLSVLCAVPLSATRAAAQQPPPVQGVTGTIATEGTIDKEHKAAGAIAAGAKKILGKKHTDENPIDGFTEGRRVVLRDIVKGDEAPPTTEGVVIDLDRKRQQITVRFENKKTQTLRLIPSDGAPDVVVSYTDDVGVKIAHDFKRVS